MRHLTMIAAAAGLALAAMPAAGQSGSGEAQVSVTVTGIAAELAASLGVDFARIPASVQAPVGIAANVCGVDANALAQQAKAGTAACTARSTSQGLDRIVQRAIRG